MCVVWRRWKLGVGVRHVRVRKLGARVSVCSMCVRVAPAHCLDDVIVLFAYSLCRREYLHIEMRYEKEGRFSEDV